MCSFNRSMLTPIVTAILLTACASNYTQFYKADVPAAFIAKNRLTPPPAEPFIERMAPSTDVTDYIKRGYVTIGVSEFNSSAAPAEDEAIEQGKKVGADLVVLLTPEYTGSSTTIVPFKTPTTTTSYSTGNATAHGRNGTVNVSGSSTTTTRGEQTTYIPVTNDHFNYGAWYLAKLRWVLGVVPRELTDAERQELQSNKGVGVNFLVNNSPAFNADILPGDLILKINGEPVPDRRSFWQIIESNSGRKVPITLYRRGKYIEKEILLM